MNALTRYIGIMAICTLALWNNPLTAQETMSSVELLQADVTARTPIGRVTSILAGTDEVPVNSKEATIPLSRGVAIIVTDPYHGLFGDEGINAISYNLNQWGWRTLVIPAPPIQLSSNNVDTASINAFSGSVILGEEAISRFMLSLSQRMEAIMAYAQDTPGYRLIISHGIAGAGLIRLYENESSDELDGLVVSAPFWPQLDINQQIPESLANTNFPVLDLISPWDNRWSNITQSSRKIKANTELKMHYRQREIIGTNLNHIQYHYISKEIYGWMTYLGW